MKDKKYFDKDLIDLHEGYSDARGIIQPLCDLNMKSASLIISKPNTWRANHYHKTDWHIDRTFDLTNEINFHADLSSPQTPFVDCWLPPAPPIEPLPPHNRDHVITGLSNRSRYSAQQREYPQQSALITDVTVPGFAQLSQSPQPFWGRSNHA